MITDLRWDELFEIANGERPIEPLTEEEAKEYRGICLTLAAIDQPWQCNEKSITARAGAGTRKEEDNGNHTNRMSQLWNNERQSAECFRMVYRVLEMHDGLPPPTQCWLYVWRC